MKTRRRRSLIAKPRRACQSFTRYRLAENCPPCVTWCEVLSPASGWYKPNSPLSPPDAPSNTDCPKTNGQQGSSPKPPLSSAALEAASHWLRGAPHRMRAAGFPAGVGLLDASTRLSGPVCGPASGAPLAAPTHRVVASAVRRKRQSVSWRCDKGRRRVEHQRRLERLRGLAGGCRQGSGGHARNRTGVYEFAVHLLSKHISHLAV